MGRGTGRRRIDPPLEPGRFYEEARRRDRRDENRLHDFSPVHQTRQDSKKCPQVDGHAPSQRSSREAPAGRIPQARAPMIVSIASKPALENDDAAASKPKSWSWW